ncbi:MAG: response regulator [Phycisphaerae bacterium]
MMAAVNSPKQTTRRVTYSILVIDDEPDVRELVCDVVGRRPDCRINQAATLAEARQRLSEEPTDLVLVDVNLPDGNGMDILDELAENQPEAQAIVITGRPSVEQILGAFRSGFIDYLPKPFDAEHLNERVDRGLSRQRAEVQTGKRIHRLRDAVRRLNQARRVVGKKVDLLCNDLVGAYGELAKQVEHTRTQDAFASLMDKAVDLEQLLCHAMDWLLKAMGHANIAVFLAGEDEPFELGAYMKYTIPGNQALTEALSGGMVTKAARDGFVHLTGGDVTPHLTDAELKYLRHQTILAADSSYLGESLAVVVLFRDVAVPFTPEHAEMLKAIAPILATSLATIVRQAQRTEDGADIFDPIQEPEAETESDQANRQDADWWKRGDEPPF